MIKIVLNYSQGVSRLGNKILMIILALRVKKLIPNSEIYGYSIPELGFIFKDNLSDNISLKKTIIVRKHNPDLQELLYQIEKTNIQKIIIDIADMTYDSIKEYKSSLRNQINKISNNFLNPLPLKDSDLLINIRANEILSNKHKDYYPLPIEVYEFIIGETEMKPVFFGQIDSGYYCSKLTSIFPNAQFLSLGVLDSFRLIMRARNKFLPISTFSYVAGWLGADNTKIIMPISGLFHPEQRGDIRIIPNDDDRFSYVKFAPQKWHKWVSLDLHLRILNSRSKPYKLLDKYV